MPDEFPRPNLAGQFVNPNKTPNKIERNDEMSESKFRYALQKKKIIEFVRKLHKDTALFINKQNTPGYKIWYQYWDYYQSQFWTK